MLPKVRDVREAVETVGYNLGYRHQPPRYARFNYMEKAEYWALVWGTVVMAITGILLWAHDAVLAYLPHALAVLEVTTAVHFYEGEEEKSPSIKTRNRRNLRKATRAILPLRPPHPRANPTSSFLTRRFPAARA